MRFVDLFCGIGGFHAALSQLGHECVFACDIDPEAAHMYEKNFGINPHYDIRECKNLPDFFKKSKGLLEYRKQSLELKLFQLKLTEAIQSRNLPESEDFEVKSREINLISEFTKEFFFSEKDDPINIPKFENLANFNRAKKTT